MREIRRSLACVAALVLLSALPAAAEVFTIHLKNGNSFETRYRPQIAAWDEDTVLLITNVGNRIALMKSDIEEVTADTEIYGFGTVIDTTTISLGLAPNDAPLPEQAADSQARLLNYINQLANRPQQDFTVQQFVEPDQAGMTGGLPAWDLTVGSAQPPRPTFVLPVGGAGAIGGDGDQ